MLCQHQRPKGLCYECLAGEKFDEIETLRAKVQEQAAEIERITFQNESFYAVNEQLKEVTRQRDEAMQAADKRFKLLGRVDSHGNVVWFDKNPHAFPPCTEFYAAIKGSEK